MSEGAAPSRATMIVAIIAVLAVAIIATMFTLRLAPTATEFTLAAVEDDVAKRFPIIPHLSATDLQNKTASGETPLLIDVRDEAEFNVSHLAGARRMNPEIAIAAAKAELVPLVAGRTVVFYCGAGLRSSVLASEVQEELLKSGAKAVFNLRGGIFGWANSGRPLVDANGPTDLVHPMSDAWKKLLTNPEKASLTPRALAGAPKP